MGDVVSSHLDEAKREIITARTGEVMGEVGRLYEQQYAVALFNKVRFDIEGGGGPQSQLLHRKIPLENKSIFSGSIFQFQEENKKWRNRFLLVPDSYNINVYDSKSSHDKHFQPKGSINCAGYKVLMSMEQYLDLISNSLPDIKAKVGGSPFLKCATQFPLILWHPYARHHYFCVTTEKEQQKWLAVLQDCVRHANDGLSEENKIQTPAFTDSVRLYRQAKGHYGTWEMMCGAPAQILSNLVMEGLHPELRELISPRLKGKLHDRQRSWMLISDAVYSLVQAQCQAQYEAVVQKCEDSQPALEASIRTDMDQIINSKEFVTTKIKAVILPKAEKLLKVSIEPYITSILEALMEPTSRGFAEVRDVFFRELVDMSKNTLNNGTKETVAQHMEKISMLAFHPVKMQSCYEKVEQLSLEGLQQRFDVSSPSVFVQRAQILMREQMDDATYTFEQILHQSLESQGTDELCKIIQRCQDRVIKKFDYDSSTVRKRFFREALLQIFIPYMLKQLSPSCASELPHFQELIFEDFSRFILVDNIFEEVVLHSVMKDIMMAVKEAAVQRRHNLYRDSIVLSNSDPSLHLLGENPSIDWAEEYGGAKDDTDKSTQDGDVEDEPDSQRKRRMKQVVSMIQVEGSPTFSESCLEVPRVDDIPEEEEGESESTKTTKVSTDVTCDSKQEEKKGKELVPSKVESTEVPAVEKSIEVQKVESTKDVPSKVDSVEDAPLNVGTGKEVTVGEKPTEVAQSKVEVPKDTPLKGELGEKVAVEEKPTEVVQSKVEAPKEAPLKGDPGEKVAVGEKPTKVVQSKVEAPKEASLKGDPGEKVAVGEKPTADVPSKKVEAPKEAPLKGDPGEKIAVGEKPTADVPSKKVGAPKEAPLKGDPGEKVAVGEKPTADVPSKKVEAPKEAPLKGDPGEKVAVGEKPTADVSSKKVEAPKEAPLKGDPGEKVAVGEKRTADVPTKKVEAPKDVPLKGELSEKVAVEEKPTEIVQSKVEAPKEAPSMEESTEKASFDVPLKTESAEQVPLARAAVESSPVSSEEEEQQAASNMEVSSEVLLPSLPEENSQTTTQTDPETTPEGIEDLSPPLHDDSGFQSPTSDAAEDNKVGTLQPEEEHPAAETSDKEASKSSDSEPKHQ